MMMEMGNGRNKMRVAMFLAIIRCRSQGGGTLFRGHLGILACGAHVAAPLNQVE